MRRDFHDLAAIILLDLLLEGLGIEEGLNGSVTMPSCLAALYLHCRGNDPQT